MCDNGKNNFCHIAARKKIREKNLIKKSRRDEEKMISIFFSQCVLQL